MAYATALRHAGARVTDAEVYSGMFDKGNQQRAAMNAISALLALMVPPEHLQEKGDGKKKEKAPATPGASSSKKRTKP